MSTSVLSNHIRPRCSQGNSNSLHTIVTDAISMWFSINNATIDAMGRIVHFGTYAIMPHCIISKVAQEIWYDLRCSHGGITREHVQSSFEVIADRMASDRRKQIISSIIGKDRSNRGVLELHRLVKAIVGNVPLRLHVVAVMHFIWLTKRSMAGMPREYDLMPIIFGQVQGSGKSTVARKFLCPLKELATDISAETLTDERRRPELGRFYAGDWDEMEGSSKSEIESIKHAITCETATYRPMRSNDTATVVRTMNFIGSSNKSVSSMVLDTSGARRFYEIPAMDVLDRAVINRIDYNMVWTCISENDPAPLIPYLAQLRDHQVSLKHGDNVSAWLEQEEWISLTWKPSSGYSEDILAYDDTLGDSKEHIRARYCHWCLLNGENPMKIEQFHVRLSQLGFTIYRPAGGKRRYRRPE